MSRSRCCIGGCNKSRGSNIGLHTFPKDLFLRRKWINNIKNTGSEFSRGGAWNGPSTQSSKNGQLVCSVHFTFDNFTLTTRTKWKLNIPCRPALIENASPNLLGSKVRVGGNPEQGITNRAVIRKRDVSRILSQYETDRQVIEQDSLQPDELIKVKVLKQTPW
ncbi:DNA binding [Mactra antiquata]